MKSYLKQLVDLLIGMLVLSMATCAPTAIQSPTAEIPTIPTATSGIPITGEDVTNTEWTLISFVEAGTETPAGQGPSIELRFQANGEAGGSGGCNAFSTRYTTQEHRITFQQILSTKMACVDPAVMEQEQKYFNALQSVTRYEVTENGLKIWYANDQNILTFSRRTAATPVAPTPSPIVAAPTILNPTATSVDVRAPERISFTTGETTASITGQLTASESDQYVLRARAGQTMSIHLAFTEGQAILVVWGADGDVLLSDHAEASNLERVLPTTQDYYLQVKGRPEGNTAYQMTITIPASGAPVDHPERVQFAAGASSAQRSGLLPSGTGLKQYVLSAKAGQTMTIEVTSHDVPLSLTITTPNGTQRISEVASTDSGYRNQHSWVLTETGDYLVTLTKADHTPSTNYQTNFTIQ